MATAPEMTETVTTDTTEQPDLAAVMYGDDTAATELPAQANDTEGDAAQTDDAAAQPEPITRPKSWGNDQNEMWAALPREHQEFIAQRESDREAMLTRRAQEAASTRQTVEAETRQAVQQMMHAHASQLEQAWRMVGMPQAPDPSLLNSNDPADYQLYTVQKARYDHAASQVGQLQTQAEQARRQAEALQSQATQQAIQADEARLLEKWPQWAEPSERAKLLAELQPIAAELGYGPEEQAQAGSADLFALHTAMSWKRDADKYRELMKKRMEPVRAARQIPPTTRVAPPVTGQRQTQDTIALMYPDDRPRT